MAATELTVAQVERALEAHLRRQGHADDAASASAFLHSSVVAAASSSDAPWQCVLTLLRKTSWTEEMTFSVLSLLRSMIRSHWLAASDSIRANIRTMLFQSLFYSSYSWTGAQNFVTDRAALCIAAAVVRDGDVAPLLDTALQAMRLPVLLALADEACDAHGTIARNVASVASHNSRIDALLSLCANNEWLVCASRWLSLMATYASAVAPARCLQLVHVAANRLCATTVSPEDMSKAVEVLRVLFETNAEIDYTSTATVLQAALHGPAAESTYVKDEHHNSTLLESQLVALGCVLPVRANALLAGEELEARALKVLFGKSRYCISTEAMEAISNVLRSISHVPIHQRPLYLQHSLHEEATHLLVLHAQQQRQDDDDEDEDAVQSFRAACLAEVAELCFACLSSRYFEVVHKHFVSCKPEDVGTIEACFYASGEAVASEAMEVLHQQAQDAMLIAGYICTMFNAVSCTSADPAASRAAARFVRSYARFVEYAAAQGWLAVEKIVHFLLQAVRSSNGATADEAANAFKALCLKAVSCFPNAASLCEQVLAVLPEEVDTSRSSDFRCYLLEGIAHAFGHSSASHEEICENSSRLAATLAERIQAVMQSHVSSERAALELGLLVSPLKLLGQNSAQPRLQIPGREHPAMVYLKQAWPVVESALISGNPQYSARACEGIALAIQAARSYVPVQSAQSLLDGCITEFERSVQNTKTLDCIVAVAEALGEHSCVYNALARAASVIAHHPALPPAALASFLQAFQSCLLLTPKQALALDLELLLQRSADAICATEREVARAGMAVVATLFSPGQRACRSRHWQERSGKISSAARSKGKKIIQSALFAVGTTASEHLFGKLGQAIVSLTSVTTRDEWLNWLQEALQEGFAGSGANATACEALVNGAKALDRLQRRRFEALVSDFAKVCRGMETNECFVSYALV